VHHDARDAHDAGLGHRFAQQRIDLLRAGDGLEEVRLLEEDERDLPFSLVIVSPVRLLMRW
jgi:hypothetical protein